MSNKAPTSLDYMLHFQEMQREMMIAQQKRGEERVKELLGEDTMVIYNGQPMYNLNSNLIIKQGLDVSELRELKALHAEKLKYFDLMRETDDKIKLKEYAHEIECIEFQMQKAWHFPEDKNFHEWYKVPKCTCPKMDNADSRGTQWRVIFSDCPVHGS